ncbi:MAG TPA: mannosyltransferase family protein [Acetobacteraceae bacterium]|nr:mannosyltransferase family protein [Acetobacteraceae bacterium]
MDRFIRRGGWRFPLAMSAVMLALLGIGMALGVMLVPRGPWYRGGGFANSLISWDGLWYLDVAQHGYSWNPSTGMLPGHYQNPDFYPLYPLIERLVMDILRNSAPAVFVATGTAFGIASVFAFERLARRLLAPDAARGATAIYAFWPASVYFTMGYPTGLINLCALAALSAYVERRYWRPALWCGIGTAAAPTLVFLAAGLCLDQGLAWLSGTRDVREIPRLIGFGLLSVSGLIGFIIFQWIALHDPLAFIKAQDAWGTSPPALVRLDRLFDIPRYFHLQTQAFQFFRHVHATRNGRMTPALRRDIQYNEQFMLNGISFVLVLAGLMAAFRRVRPLAVPLAALAGLIGYLWFIVATNQNMTATPRLLYPAIAVFLGLGALTARSRLLLAALLSLLGALTVMNGVAAASGYFLI